MNRQPLAREILVLTVISSKVERVKRLRKDLPGTTVEIGPSDYGELKRPSIVDCNDLKPVPLAEFNARFVRRKIRCFDKDLPVALRKALRKAIHNSKILTPEMKASVAKP